MNFDAKITVFRKATKQEVKNHKEDRGGEIDSIN